MTEADGFVKTLTALELKGDAFFAPVLLDDFSGDSGTFDGGSTNGGVFTIIQEKNFAEFDLFISLHGELIDTEGVAFLHAVLFTAGFENCVGHDLGIG